MNVGEAVNALDHLAAQERFPGHLFDYRLVLVDGTEVDELLVSVEGRTVIVKAVAVPERKQWRRGRLKSDDEIRAMSDAEYDRHKADLLGG